MSSVERFCNVGTREFDDDRFTDSRGVGTVARLLERELAGLRSRRLVDIGVFADAESFELRSDRFGGRSEMGKKIDLLKHESYERRCLAAKRHKVAVQDRGFNVLVRYVLQR